jgi:outer membrane beta-barrel protein
MLPFSRMVMTAALVAVLHVPGLAFGAEEIPPATPVPAATPAPEPTPDPYRPRTVIQERIYRPHHEFRLGLGYLPQDPFYKAYGPELAYVWHIGDWLEWEIFRAAYFAYTETEIRRQVASEFDISKDPYEKVQYLAFSHVRWVPFYGRYTVLNRSVVHSETFLSGGAGMIGWKKAEGPRADGADPGEGGTRPAFDVGLGFRFYTSRRTSLTIDVHDQFIMRYDGSLGTQFYITVGGSFAAPQITRPASLQ